VDAGSNAGAALLARLRAALVRCAVGAGFHVHARGVAKDALLVVSTQPAEPCLVADSTRVTWAAAQDAPQEMPAGAADLCDSGSEPASANFERVWAALRAPLLRPELFASLRVAPPRGFLLSGPPGVGKTWSVRRAARASGATLVLLDGSTLHSALAGESEAHIHAAFASAAAAASAGSSRGALLFVDELDVLCPARREDGLGASPHAARVVAHVIAELDALAAAASRVIVVGATNRPNAVDAALRRPGRFDREIALLPPTLSERAALLRALTRRLRLAEQVDLQSLAERCVGCVGADLVALVREAAWRTLTARRGQVERGDFERALTVVGASSMRGHAVQREATSFEDIGGYDDVKAKLRQALHWPLRHPDTMARLGLRAPRGILLHGPPGCAKTSLVRALANEASAAFLSLSAAAVLSSLVGESEQIIRDAFARARANQPCILFFDEVDGVFARRAYSSEQERDEGRLLATLLTEMDGVEVAEGVLVVAATNRLAALDAALLRPGRFDLLLHVPPPDVSTRRAVLVARTRRMPLAPDVDLSHLATATQGFSGADLSSLCREAAMHAMRAAGGSEASRVSARDFEAALRDVKPSL
jgi:transitional endoplasmic reticulum ATPase